MSPNARSPVGGVPSKGHSPGGTSEADLGDFPHDDEPGEAGGGVGVEGKGADDGGGVRYRVAMLGQNGVGKTALVSQFLTSEYMNTYDTSLGECLGFVYTT